MNNYVVLHLHDDRSLLDSCTKFSDYVKKAKELGQIAIALTNHGVIYNWVSNKQLCDKEGIKYIHGVEVYMTERLQPQVRDNYHTILLAKNHEGVKEINKLVSISNKKDHFYYKPRITFDEFFNISDNVIKLSACLASPLNSKYIQGDRDLFNKLIEHYDYLEIQPHNSKEQKSYNKMLYELSKRYNKPLVATTDTHSLNPYKAECRTMLQLSKGIEFQNEDTFDLTYKSYSDIIGMFKTQGVLPEEVFLQAIENTNVIADSVEEFTLDRTAKYPILYQDDEKVIKKKIVDNFKHKIAIGEIKTEEVEQFKKNINEEFEVFKATNMLGFMLSMSELVEWCHDNGIPTGFGRGSVCGSSIAYILNIIDVNPVKFHTIFSRFCNKNRIELGDIDVDFPPEMRGKVYEHIFNQFGYDKCAYVLALGTISDKGCIDDIGRGIKDESGARKYSLAEMEEIKSLYDVNPTEARKKYSDIFYYFDGMLNTYVSLSMHPAGVIISPVELEEEYGTLVNNDLQILQLDMEDSHDVNLVKYDILGLKSISVINDACQMAGIKYPLSYEINWEDENVYNEIKLSPVGIFQYESNFAWDSVKKFDCHSIFDLSLVNACIRPSGESYRDKLLNRISHKNPSKIIDDMLKDNLGWMIYQEDTIKFLQEICGLSGSDADSIRRAIGKKDADYINKMLPVILDGYCKHSDKPRAESEKEAKEFIQVIQDSSSYSFGYNHSIAYSMIGYLCGWLRHYHPYEFIVSYLNNAQNQDDLNNGAELIKQKGMRLAPAQFRHSQYGYYFDKSNSTIYKGLGSVKFLNKECADELFEIGKTFNGTFLELLTSLTKANTKQIKVLILLGYFKEFGKTLKLLDFYNQYLTLWGKKQFKKDNNKLVSSDTFVSGLRTDKSSIVVNYSIDLDKIAMYCAKETDKQYSQFDYKAYLEFIWNEIPDTNVPLDDILKAQLYFIGTLSYVDERLSNVYMVTEFKYYNDVAKPYLVLYNLGTGEQIKTKITNAGLYMSNPINLYSIIQVLKWKESYKKTKTFENGKSCYKDTDEKQNILEDYVIIK